MPASPRTFGSTPVPLAYFDTNFTLRHMRQHSHEHFECPASASDSAGTADTMSTRPWDCTVWILPRMAWHFVADIESLDVVQSVSSRLISYVSLRLRLSCIRSDSSSAVKVLTSSVHFQRPSKPPQR